MFIGNKLLQNCYYNIMLCKIGHILVFSHF